MTAAAREIERDLVAEPIVAWRAWWLAPHRYQRFGGVFHTHVEGGFWIESIATHTTWKPGANVASCYHREYRRAMATLGLGLLPLQADDHDAPHAGCQCGFWAFKERHVLEEQLVGYWLQRPAWGSIVIGRVELWGRIVETQDGWRAEYARPVDLEVVAGDREARELEAAYGVPVRRVRLPLRLARAGCRRRLVRCFFWGWLAMSLTAAAWYAWEAASGRGWRYAAYAAVNLACAAIPFSEL